MMQYEIQFKASAAKEFRKLPVEIKARLQKAINALKTEPRPPGMKKLAGTEARVVSLPSNRPDRPRAPSHR